MARNFLLLLFLVVSPLAQSATLSGNLSASDVSRIAELISTPAATRLLRSAESYSSWPGIKFGVEVFTLGSRGVNSIGNGTGTLPALSPVPRLYLAKGLFWRTELIFNYFPASDVNPVSSLGFLFKHCFYEEAQSWLSVAAYLGFTSLSGFQGTYSGTDIEIGAVASRDYVRLKPYLGLGAMAARGSVSSTLLAATNKESGAWFTTLHGFLGMEIELPLNFGIQLDLFNLSLGTSLFVGKKF